MSSLKRTTQAPSTPLIGNLRPPSGYLTAPAAQGARTASGKLSKRPPPDCRAQLREIMEILRSISLVDQSQPSPARNGDALPTQMKKCLIAMEGLQSTLLVDLHRQQQLERDALATQEELARTHTELLSARRLAEKARRDSLNDNLTELPNRTYFLSRLEKALTRAEPEDPAAALSVMFIDLDGFKPVNDRHGHLVGDALLKIIGTRLARAVRVEDTMSRMGGDEFACLVPASGRDEMAQLASKLHTTVSHPVTIGDLTLSVKPSIGIASCPDSGTTVVSLLRAADTAMYRAKRQRLGFAFDEPGAPPVAG